jgi:hypothetical protein
VQQDATIQGVSDIRQIEIHTAEPLVSDRNHFEVEIAIEKFKKVPRY